MSFQKRALIALVFFLLPILSPSVGFTITLEEEIKQAQLLIEELRTVTPGTKAADQVAMKIMQNYQCKRLLKSKEYSDIGATFHDLIYGDNGIAQRTLNKAKAKLAENQKYKSLSDRVESIRNKSSAVSKKPPMDLDFGVLAKDNDDLKRILSEIKANGGDVSDFHEALQQALEDSFKEVGELMGLPADAINPKSAFIAGTTGFHPEAYKDVGAIKGDTPLKDLVSQSADVSRYKINELQHLVDDGLISAESAAQEAARGTLKDLDKLETTFASIAERTGKKPTLRSFNEELRILLQELVDANDPQAAQDVLAKINALTKGRQDIFSACNNLIDNMEAAWKLADASDPELLFKRLLKDLLPEADYQKALKALEEENLDDLPVSFKNLRTKIFNIAAAKRTSLSKPTVEDILKQLEGNLMLKDIKGDTRQVLIELIEQLDLGDDPKLFNAIFGEELAGSFKKIKDLMADSVKGSLVQRLSKRIPLKTLDGKWTSLELGDSGSVLGADAFIGIAMTYNDINNIMDKNLPADEEDRELQKAVVTNMPIVGDFLMSINTSVDAYYEGDWSKGAESAAYLVIGIGGMVPGAQIPALIAGLGMATTQISGLAWDAYWDRKLVESWVKSGVWDKENGKLLGIKDNKDKTLEIDFEALAGNFTGQYLNDYDKMTIRDSIFYYTEKHLLKGNKTIESFKMALNNLYPEANLDEALREPGKRGEGLLRAAIKLAGDGENIDRNLALGVYRKYKQAFDSCAKQAIDFLKSQAEAEYQALHQVGEAKEKREALEKLGKELKVPLVARVEDTFKSFITFLGAVAESTVSIDSMSLKRQKVFENYLDEYTLIKNKIMMASGMITRLGLNPPAQWNLTGYINIDKERADEIYNAYLNALSTAKEDAAKIHNEKIGNKPAFSLEHPCDNDMRQKLASIKIRIAHSKDLQSLYRKRANMAGYTDIKTLISENMPLDAMVDVVQKHDFEVNELEIYTEATENLDERIKRLDEEYAQAIKDTEKQLKKCFEEKEKAEKDKTDQEKADKAKADQEKADKVKADQEKVDKAKADKAKADRERADQATADQEKADQARVAQEKADREKVEQENAAKEKAEQEKREQAAAQQQEANVVYKFSGVVSSVWEGGGNEEQFRFNRTQAKFDNPDDMCGVASVAGNVWGKLNTTDRTMEYYTKELESELPTHKSWGRGATLKSFSVDGFTGQMVETKVTFIGGGWSDEGFRASEASASTHGYVMKGNQVIEFGYGVNGSGCFNNTDRSYLESQIASGQGEARGIISSLKLVKDGKFETVPYKGPKLDGSSLPKISLNPSSLKPLKLGEIVMITAVVENAEPEDSPFSYTWAGEFSGKESAVTLTGKTPGKSTISVSVDGARYPLGSASLAYEVEDFKATIERVPNTQNPIAVGGSVGLKATLLSGGKPVTGDYIYRWQPHPEVKFNDLDSKNNQTTATFTRLGETKVWVQILKKEGEALTTVAESDQLEINIIKPKLSLSATPQAALVGEEVTLKAVEFPAMDDKTVSFWWESKGNTLNAGALANERDYSFKSKDIKPVVITVHAKGLDVGDDLGEQSLTLTANPYSITVSKPKPRGPTPQIWKEGKGLVDVENAIAVFQDVSVNATVSPTSKNTPLRYKWTVSPEGCTLSSPSSQETTANASHTGSYSLQVVVTDSQGIELGIGNGSIPVTISQEEVKAGSQKAETVSKKLTQAKETSHLGKYDEAISSAQEALAVDPKNTEVSGFIAQVKKEKEKADQGLRQVDQLINASDFVAVQNALNAVKSKGPNYPPAQAMETKLNNAWQEHNSNVKAALGDVRDKYERKDYKEALAAIDEARRTLKLLPSELKTLAENESLCKEKETKKEQARTLFKSAKEKLAAFDYNGSIKDYQEGQSISVNLWNINTDTTMREAERINAEAVAKKKTIEEQLQVNKGALDLAPDKARSKNVGNPLTHLGKYNINANGYLEQFVLSQESGTLKGVWGQDVLQNVSFDGTTLVFTRLTQGVTQVATGKISGSSPKWHFDGEFSSGGGPAIYKWFADMTEPAQPKSPPIIAPSAAILGKSFINANGYTGQLILSRKSGALEGVVIFGSTPEVLQNISFDGTTLTFTRPIPNATQVYTGKISGSAPKWHFDGEFSQGGGPAIYKWFADLTEPALP